MPEYVVKLVWNAEAAVWVATIDGIKGLVLECSSLDAFIKRIRFAANEIMKLSG
jgi:hypothetical protein